MTQQGLLKASGVVLGRSRVGEGGLWLTLFLKGQGVLRASAPGAERGRVRFGGGTEPFVWGAFQLHRGRNGGLYLNAADVADDMLALRRRPEALLMAVSWSKLLNRYLSPDCPEDALLTNLYWNMKLLANPSVPAEASGWRFLYRWLMAWGLAPDLGHCSRCGRALTSPDAPAGQRCAWSEDGLTCPACDAAAQETFPSFSAVELGLLRRVIEGDTKDVAQLFERAPALRVPAGEGELAPFALASRCATGLLRYAL